MSIASLLAVEEANDKKGKPYYKFEILTRTGSLPSPSPCPPYRRMRVSGFRLIACVSLRKQRQCPSDAQSLSLKARASLATRLWSTSS